MKETDGPINMVRTLMEHHVPSFGPQTGIALLGIEEQVRLAAEKEADKETKRLLNIYADSLKVVCSVAALHQGAVIGMLDKIVTDAKTPKMWPSNLGS